MYPGELDLSRRVVVTGVGLVSALGIGTEETWQAVRAGRNGIGTITQFDATEFACRIAGEVKNFDPPTYVEKKEIKKMGRFIQFAIAASEYALRGSGLKVDAENAERVGVYIGSGIGGFEVIEREHKNLLQFGPRRISPFFIPATIVNLASGYVSIRTGAKGPNSATATACTTSAHSIGDSFKIIQRGDADVMICGGAEACISPDGHRRICGHARAFHAQRRAGARLAPVGQGPRRLRGGRGRRHPGAGRTGNRQAARRPHPGRDGGLRHERRRFPRHRAVRRRRRRVSRDAQRPARRQARARARSITSTRTAPPRRWATASRPWPSSAALASTPTKCRSAPRNP